MITVKKMLHCYTYKLPLFFRTLIDRGSISEFCTKYIYFDFINEC